MHSHTVENCERVLKLAELNGVSFIPLRLVLLMIDSLNDHLPGGAAYAGNLVLISSLHRCHAII